MEISKEELIKLRESILRDLDNNLDESYVDFLHKMLKQVEEKLFELD